MLTKGLFMSVSRMFLFILMPLALGCEFFLLATQPHVIQWFLGLTVLAIIPLGIVAFILLAIGR